MGSDIINIFMNKAIDQAKKALISDDVPVGAIIVKDNKIISEGYNKRHKESNALLHAELVAIDKACKALSSCFLDGCDMYVTLEPCPMCAGAIIQSRIKRLYFGAFDMKAGCAGSVTDLFILPFNHKVEYYGGIEEEKCKNLLTDFFMNKRGKNNE